MILRSNIDKLLHESKCLIFCRCQRNKNTRLFHLFVFQDFLSFCILGESCFIYKQNCCQHFISWRVFRGSCQVSTKSRRFEVCPTTGLPLARMSSTSYSIANCLRCVFVTVWNLLAETPFHCVQSTISWSWSKGWVQYFCWIFLRLHPFSLSAPWWQWACSNGVASAARRSLMWTRAAKTIPIAAILKWCEG